MEVLNTNLENASKNIAYAEEIANWLLKQKIPGDCKEMINRMANALGTADCELSKFITYGVSDAKDKGAEEARRQIRDERKSKERA